MGSFLGRWAIRGRESKQKVRFPFPRKRGPWALDGPGGVQLIMGTDRPIAR